MKSLTYIKWECDKSLERSRERRQMAQIDRQGHHDEIVTILLIALILLVVYLIAGS